MIQKRNGNKLEHTTTMKKEDYAIMEKEGITESGMKKHESFPSFVFMSD